VRQLLGLGKTMIIGGVLFLFPLVFVTFVVGRAFALMQQVTRPIVDRLALDRTIAAVAVIDAVAVIALLAGCLVAGLVAQSEMGRAVYRALDDNLAGVIPGYAVLRARLGDAVEHDQRKALRTVLVRLDDCSQLALEVERLADGMVVAFLPGAPDPWSGTAVIVEAARVTPLGLDTMTLTRLLKDLGWGTAAALKQVPPTP
jgi:uncharacterized membrane protein